MAAALDLSKWAVGAWDLNTWVEAPDILTTSIPGGSVGAFYGIALAANGNTPLTWTLDSGAFPDGLSITTDGIINGVPTTEETQNPVVKATNAAGFDTQAYSITIGPASAGGATFAPHQLSFGFGYGY